nr:maleylpyruvate isomerase family mycothiol-dependent enzyme [Pseudonocardia parietis]
MLVNDVWKMVHEERAVLADDMREVADELWDTPSLCPGWTVHDVVAHLVESARTSRTRFAVKMLRARMDFDRQNAAGIARERGSTPAETLTRLVACIPLTATPPAPLDTRLVEMVVHGEDIRRPLRISRTYPHEAVRRALRLQARTSTSFGGARQSIAGVRLSATDADLSIGDGPEVVGTALSLLLAISGRPVEPGELDGPGVAELVQACGAA